MDAVVVTGATSMTGGSLIRSLLNHGIKKIYAIIQVNSANVGKLPVDDRIKCIFCNCEDYDQLPEMIGEQCDVFYHFAWIHSKIISRERYFDVETGVHNIEQTIKALEAAVAIGCRAFVGAGSQAEYGNMREIIQSPDDPTDPITAYAIAKDACRRLCMLKSKELGIDVQWVRIFSVYGPHDRKNTLISTIIPKLKNNEDVDLTDCTQTWDYLYEDDAGEALYYVGNANDSNVFCLGSGNARPLREYVEEMKTIMNSNSSLNFGVLEHSRDAVMNLHADITSLKNKTGWRGPNVTFDEGIKNILNFCENVIT